MKEMREYVQYTWHHINQHIRSIEIKQWGLWSSIQVKYLLNKSGCVYTKSMNGQLTPQILCELIFLSL